MKTVLITGASSGIGKEIAKVFASKKHNLVLVARREELLNEIKEELINKYSVNVDVFVCDIINNSKKIYEYCLDNNIKVDVLINNAGYGTYGDFINNNIDSQLKMIELNNMALVELTYYFASIMKENGGGHIINVGSVASFVPGPNMAIYYATKAFVLSFSEAIRQELKKDHINVSVLCPGSTKSNFWKIAFNDSNVNLDNKFMRSTGEVGKTCYHLYSKNLDYEIDGLLNKICFKLLRLLPISLTSKIVGFVQNKTKKIN